jgi:hypothetical protein
VLDCEGFGLIFLLLFLHVFIGKLTSILKSFTCTLSVQAPPQAAAAAAAPAPAQTLAAQAQNVPMNADQQVAEMTKWASAMGMPKISQEDMKKMVEMQSSMMGQLKSMPTADINQMRDQQNSLADEVRKKTREKNMGGMILDSFSVEIIFSVIFRILKNFLKKTSDFRTDGSIDCLSF